MTKQEILEYYNDINVVYNDCGKYDSLKNMLDELEQEIRNEAITEFAERLKENYQSHAIDICLRQNVYYSYSNACYTLESYIDEIAEEMKAGGIE